MVFLQNISIKKQSEFLDKVIDSFVHPFYVVDVSDYRIKLANSAAQTGDLSKESTCYALVHQMGRPCGSSENICPIDIIKRTKQSVILEHTHYDKDGNRRYLEINAYPMFDGKGNVSDIVEYIIDISDRRKAEKALLEGEKKYHMLFESSNDAVCITTRKGDIDDCNQAFFALFGYTKDDLDKLKIQEIYHNPKDRSAFQRMVEQKEFVKDYEVKFQKKNGQAIDCLVTAAVRKAADGNIFGYQGIILRDITEQKRVTEALSRSNKELLKQYKQRKILSKRLIDLLEKDRPKMAVELHDHIGQVLTSLKMNLEIIHDNLGPADTALEAEIKTAEEKAIQLLKDVKNISHGLKPVLLDTLGLAPALRELFTDVERDTDITIDFFSSDFPQRLHPEKELAIYRVTQEALSNIIKHSRAKKVFVNLFERKEVVSLSIEDDGLGFERDKIKSTLESKKALGLIIMEERITQVGGEFSIESQIGQGTLLSVEIPI